MRLPGLGRLRKLGVQVRFHLSPRALVLLYHRVAAPGSDPQLLAVSPANFAAQLQVIRELYRPLSLRALHTALQQGRVPHRGVAVTFDDGYADNLLAAKPVLEHYHVPGTVFVTSGALDRTLPFWWDELAALLLGRQDLPSSVAVRLGGRLTDWRLTPAERQPEGAIGASLWSVQSVSDPTPAHTVYRELCALVQPLDLGAREAVLAQLRQQLGEVRGNSRALTTMELRSLAQGGWVEIGAHTVNHVRLSALSVERQAAEIATSKRTLDELTAVPVTTFSYPFGGRTDYTGETVELVKRSGFACACSNFEGVVARGTDPLQLPRFIVRDWDGLTFAAQLHDWFTRPRPC